MIATITLNPSIDQNILVQGLLKDDANRATGIHRSAGGKGLNVSKVVRELGGPTRAYALTGGFVGEYWAKLARGIDVDFRTHAVKGETRINTVLTDTRDATQTRISAPGPGVSEREARAFLKTLLAVRPKPFFWVLGGSLPGGMDPAMCRVYIAALQKNGTPCVLDADGDTLRRGIEAKPFLIKPNEFEMERLAGRKLKGAADYLSAARAVVRGGVRVVIVSLGAEGALVVSEQGAFRAPGVDVPVKSKVGAGDSLIGGALLGLFRGATLEESVRLGIAASTSAVMREAPRLCLRKDVPGLLKKTRILPV
jgi:1-phosphofructokinase